MSPLWRYTRLSVCERVSTFNVQVESLVIDEDWAEKACTSEICIIFILREKVFIMMLQQNGKHERTIPEMNNNLFTCFLPMGCMR